MRRFLASILSFTLLLTVLLSGSAYASKEKVHNFSDKELQKIQQEAELIAPYISVNGKELLFNAEEAEKNGVPADLIKRTTSDFSKLKESKSLTNEKVVTAASCNGVTKIESTWYGSIVYYNSCQAGVIAGMLSSGSGAATIAAAIAAYQGKPVTALFTGVAAGLLAIGSGVVSAAASYGTGITIRYVDSYITTDIPFWVWAQ